ncbi:MAG: SpoIIE family protein phosphatase, partial [Candidatus Omnitrophica bacterium]|nr:SpoIIE family protein phosphatase [Candidatus Omnitrophota bacterium]
DDLSLQAFGRWPWPRANHAALLDILNKEESKPKVIFFDIIFPENDIEHPGDDAMLAEKMKESGNVIVPVFFFDFPKKMAPPDEKMESPGFKTIFDKAQCITPIPRPLPPFLIVDELEHTILPILENTKSVGSVNVPPDEDGRTRHIPLFFRFRGTLFPSATLRVVLDYFDLSTKDISFPSQGVAAFRIKGKTLRVPVTSQGGTPINYVGPPECFKRYSFIRLIAEYDKPDHGKEFFKQFKDSIVFYGLSGTGTVDLRPTPFAPLYPAVIVQANLVDNFLKGKFLGQMPWYAMFIFLVAIGLVLSTVFSKLPPLKGLIVATASFAGLLSISILTFIFANYWIRIFVPSCLIFAVYLLILLRHYLAERFAKELIQQELQIAQRIQKSFLPQQVPAYPGIEIAAESVAAKEVGGDLYDFLAFPENRLGIVIGDVSGKGVPAALFMARTISEFRSRAKGERSSTDVSNLNEAVSKNNTSGLFVTFLYLILDTKTQRVSFSNAGHHALLRYVNKTGEIEPLNTKKGMPIGIMPVGIFDEGTATLEKGDIIVLFTDGIEEAMSKRREEFGMERLTKALREAKDSAPGEIVKHIIKAVRTHAEGTPQHDDLTLVVAKISNQ